MKEIDRERGEAKEQQDKQQRDPNDPFFQLGYGHRSSAPRDHDPVNHEPKRGIKEKEQYEKENRAARKKSAAVI